MKQRRFLFLKMAIAFSSVIASSAGLAQFREIRIGVDGLTCSQCTRSVEMQLRRLAFVDRVTMDLDSTRGRMTLRAGHQMAPKRIAIAVTNAGFSIRYLHLILDRPGRFVAGDSCILIAELVFRSMDVLPADTSGAWKLVLPVSQFGKRKQALRYREAGCGVRIYQAIVRKLED